MKINMPFVIVVDDEAGGYDNLFILTGRSDKEWKELDKITSEIRAKVFEWLNLDECFTDEGRKTVAEFMINRFNEHGIHAEVACRVHTAI